ncbi:HlyD family efflux transporter periplasmic adaptor subunit [Streptacidiphilus jiangxiensis]|uniref:HlyD family secretion protein n=1 Tax=Streptacidiphilus jiangxiensis TaxID=235985 RepID=A0A1H7V465_STRJI|nr:HlyD family efflux transporter periplasmic adaptor subunit [Streptacidiphilus jiangxiensis]SEM03966.1 HlyD family secretion protein [Streptacidiphilus jiangxiensis]
MQFRQKALAKQRSPEDLQVPAQLARPQGRFVLLVTAAVLAAAGYWAVTGTIATRVNEPGILVHAEGSYVLQSPVAGQVVAVYAREGDTLAAGAPLLGVRTGPRQKLQTVRTVAAGRVGTLVAALGSVVATGSDVATVERVTGPDEPLVAVVYVSADRAAAIPAGAAVDLTVQSVSVQQYGLLLGRVAQVGSSPQSPQQIAAFLGSDRLGQAFGGQDGPGGQDGKVAVVVRLERSAATASGYAWTSAEGPPGPLRSAVLVSAAVQLPGRHPIDWILP